MDRDTGRLGGEVNISIISGSRADYGLLEWPTKLLREDPYFSVAEIKIWGASPAQALQAASDYLADAKPDMLLILGDRFEIMAAAMAAHLLRIPIAHIAGGDVTEGSYDDAMRDCISRMSCLHLVTSGAAQQRLATMGITRNVHCVGNPGIDYIRHADWKRERPLPHPYLVVSYQAETIDGTNDWEGLLKAINFRRAVFFLPNPDAGSARIREQIELYKKVAPDTVVHESLPHGEFLNLLLHCEEFIGNSSAMLYEAPELGVKCRMLGKRQRGRVVPVGDGLASERIRNILRTYGNTARLAT